MKLAVCLIPNLVILSTVMGCSSKDPARKEVFPVTGEVHVDGQPAAKVEIHLIDDKGMDPEFPTAPSAITDQNGRFAITSYDQGDGAPAGTYSATFTWTAVSLFNQSTGAPDKLRGRYGNPQTSKIKVTVESTPVDMGKIELKTR